MWLYRRSGLRWLLHKTGLVRLLPERLQAMESLLPELSLKSMFSSLPTRIRPEGTPRMKVGLILGCVQRVLFDDVNLATARVLAAEGCEVIIPPGQGCCGALGMHAGREREALQMARKMIRLFEREQVDVIAVNAAGCGSNLKDYGVLLADDSLYAERARRFSAKCKDITVLLAGLEARAPRHPVPLRVAYHDSCHLQHALGVRTEPRKLLAGIPELEVQEIAEAAICCGSAGIYNLVQPGTAAELGERKARNIVATKAEARRLRQPRMPAPVARFARANSDTRFRPCTPFSCLTDRSRAADRQGNRIDGVVRAAGVALTVQPATANANSQRGLPLVPHICRS